MEKAETRYPASSAHLSSGALAAGELERLALPAGPSRGGVDFQARPAGGFRPLGSQNGILGAGRPGCAAYRAGAPGSARPPAQGMALADDPTPYVSRTSLSEAEPARGRILAPIQAPRRPGPGVERHPPCRPPVGAVSPGAWRRAPSRHQQPHQPRDLVQRSRRGRAEIEAAARSPRGRTPGRGARAVVHLQQGRVQGRARSPAPRGVGSMPLEPADEQVIVEQLAQGAPGRGSPPTG